MHDCKSAILLLCINISTGGNSIGLVFFQDEQTTAAAEAVDGVVDDDGTRNSNDDGGGGGVKDDSTFGQFASGAKSTSVGQSFVSYLIIFIFR